ncbi:hypothetical protein L596_022717 [Steinernema carpocapsae]|uniref:C-type lectin domain-containing protein n=1 Tax=Steinernema carpocapsae TaxID=34508 RepID=A0A4U5MMM2_STECR|nr:hypothetical protein L596_022717 [Steinernema carpocapsae]
MTTILILILLLATFAASHERVCPPGAVTSQDRFKCFFIVPVSTIFGYALRTCQNMNYRFASIDNDVDNDRVSETAYAMFRNMPGKHKSFWIGGVTASTKLCTGTMEITLTTRTGIQETFLIHISVFWWIAGLGIGVLWTALNERLMFVKRILKGFTTPPICPTCPSCTSSPQTCPPPTECTPCPSTVPLTSTLMTTSHPSTISTVSCTVTRSTETTRQPCSTTVSPASTSQSTSQPANSTQPASTSTQIPTTTIPPGWKQFNNSLYYFNPNATSWGAAEKWCQTQNAHLTSILSKKEDDFIGTICFGVCWIGAHSQGRKPAFKWSDSSRMSFTHWQVGQPKTYKGSFNCAWYQFNGWFAYSCAQSYPFVCKKPYNH